MPELIVVVNVLPSGITTFQRFRSLTFDMQKWNVSLSFCRIPIQEHEMNCVFQFNWKWKCAGVCHWTEIYETSFELSYPYTLLECISVCIRYKPSKIVHTNKVAGFFLLLCPVTFTDNDESAVNFKLSRWIEMER